MGRIEGGSEGVRGWGGDLPVGWEVQAGKVGRDVGKGSAADRGMFGGRNWASDACGVTLWRGATSDMWPTVSGGGASLDVDKPGFRATCYRSVMAVAERWGDFST